MKVDISRAYSYARNKRAKKAVSILREQLQKQEDDVSVSSELNNLIWSEGAQNPPKTVEVEIRDGVAYPAEE